MANPGLSEADMQEALEAFEKHGTKVAAAESLGLHPNTYGNRYRQAQQWRDADPAAKAASVVVGSTSIPNLLWAKTDAKGNVTYSAQYKYSKEHDVGRTIDALREGLEAITPAQYVSTPDAPSSLCAVFPVADLHVGLLTDQEEVGEDWDSKKAGDVFRSTFGRLVSVTPSAGVAILAQLGDLTHTDDQRNVTPQSGHQLDADTRYFMILRRAVAVMKWGIEELRKKYPKVIYRGVRGNHDMTAHYAVTLALAEHYKDVESVQVIDNAGEFYVHEFGSNMVLLHHGDKARPDRLVHFAAAEWPEMWGRTRHRIALSGHVHHETKKEVGGMTFESVGTIIPRDVHAYSHAYTAKRSLVSITLDQDEGEITRAKVGVLK